MPVVINGTTGISGVDGTAASPAIEGTDTNTGMFFPAADTAAITTNGVERMRVDSAGNVGIGISPAATLDVLGPVSTTFAPNIVNSRLTGSSSATSGSSGAGISFRGYTTGTTAISDLAFISGIKENTTDANYSGALVFGTRLNGTGGGDFEHFRIGSAGQLGISGANYGTSGQVLTSGGSSSSPSWSEATSMTLLGTLTTTTGTTQTLSSLTLTTYKQIVCVFQGVVRSAAFMLVGTSAADDVQCSASAGATDNGYIWIDLTTGRFATVVGSGIWGSDSVLGTASTSIAFSVSSGSFSGGSILIYGVR